MGRGYRIERWDDAAIPDRLALRKQMAADGYSVFEWSDRPGAVYETHSHATDQSHWIVSGKLELDVAGVGAVVLAPGDRDFLPAGTCHSARVAGNEPVVYLIGEKFS